MSESESSEPVLGRTIDPVGADAETRDATGARFGGEKLGKHPTPLIWLLMAVIVAGCVLGGIAIIVNSMLLFIVGVVVAAVGGLGSLAGGVMHMTE